MRSAKDKERYSSAPELGHPTTYNYRGLPRATTKVVFVTTGAIELGTAGILSEQTLFD